MAQEYKAGRLPWTKANVKKLILDFPKCKCDEQLQAQGEYEGQMAEGIEDDTESGSEPEGSEDGSQAHDSEEDAAVVAAASAAAKEAIVLPLLCGQAAEDVRKQTEHLRCLTEAFTTLQECGLVGPAVQIDNAIRKHRRVMRGLARGNSAVANAFLEIQDRQARHEREERQRVDEANKSKKALADAKAQVEKTKEAIKKQKAELMNTERLLETRNSVQNFSLQALGEGSKVRSGGVSARKNRLKVLTRLAQLGTGLSAAQKNDWEWFANAWDRKMAQQFEHKWGSTFASWMQKVLDDIGVRVVNAFSTFVHNETRRCFGSEPMLSIPPAQ